MYQRLDDEIYTERIYVTSITNKECFPSIPQKSCFLLM